MAHLGPHTSVSIHPPVRAIVRGKLLLSAWVGRVEDYVLKGYPGWSITIQLPK
jgi:hypothetical protein